MQSEIGTWVVRRGILLGAAIVAALATPLLANDAFAATKTVLHRFNGADGGTPVGGVVRGQNGELYGVTFKGGRHGKGTIFMLTPPIPPARKWTHKVLHHFASGPKDGHGPQAGLTRDKFGRLYGTTFYGGATSGGTMFRLSPPKTANGPWRYERLHSLDEPRGGYAPHTPVALDRDGNVYGFTYGGGDGTPSGNYGGILYKIARQRPARTTPWITSTLYTFSSLTYGDVKITVEAGRPIFSADGSLINTSRIGGADNYGTVFRMTWPNGPDAPPQPEILHSFATAESGWPRGGVIAGADGALYGTTMIGGANGGGTVFRLQPPVAPSATWIYTKLFDHPAQIEMGVSGLVMDGDGALYGALYNGGVAGRGVIYKLSPPVAGRPAWRRTVLHNFHGAANGSRPSDVTLGPGNVLYGTTYEGGTACNCGTVFMLEP